MVSLMIYSGPAAADAVGSRTGGVPLVPAGFVWPSCASCEGAMQFLGQLDLPDGSGLLSIFMCQNDPGLCDEWDATSGGNRALLFKDGELTPASVPSSGNTDLGEVSMFRVVDMASPDYDEAAAEWRKHAPEGQRAVIGQLGGTPSWLQGAEQPECETCGRSMTFAAQLEEGHDDPTSANYGGGCAYAFTCPTCRTAAFLWQQ